jgi:ribosomal peptide maturation radical SAM protein 1
MPWASTVFPSLGAGLMVSAARSRGFTADGYYPSLDLCATIGPDTYEWMASEQPMFALGEHLFAVDLFGKRELASDRFLRRFGPRHPAVRRAGIDWDRETLKVLRDQVVPAFLEECVAEVLTRRPRIIGFSCVFNQALPSLALARRLRAVLPETLIVFGGGLMHGPMGPAYARAFPAFVDHVFNGEADIAFPQFLETWRDGGDPRAIPGITVHGALTSPAVPVTDLDAIPTPDFDAFFDRRAALTAAGGDLAPLERLSFESARGCWWGQKHHCVFCGLNNEGMTFRAKSAERVVEELVELSSRYGVTDFAASDNILVRSGYTTLLPRIAELGLDFRFFYEIKANVTRDEVAALARAGVKWVVPGIESFADHVLQLMRKGSTAAMNVQLLKWLQEHDVEPLWNLLVGFAGETDEDFEEMTRLLPSLQHLPPPSFGQGLSNLVQIHRFAPYHDNPETFGLRNVRAAAFYDHLIPSRLLRGDEYGYFFEHDLDPDAPLHRHRKRLDAVLCAWQGSAVRMRAHLGPGLIRITRTGPVSAAIVLDRPSALVFLLLDSQTTAAKVAYALAELLPDEPVPVEAVIARLVTLGVAVRAGDRYVSTIPFATPQTSASLRTWLERWAAPVTTVSVPPSR